MVGLYEGGNEPPGSLKTSNITMNITIRPMTSDGKSDCDYECDDVAYDDEENDDDELMTKTMEIKAAVAAKR
ncbi:hypothetical protein ANN_15382 [Periplaneta americana]|uniref:Uncharacterized protein n=1 Tax=Periplaneta americana TaxID=6978 RepID=A0ABQ8SI42_PERAM|nr:hypothetical protein ANN_15382 [Periplaneta americana]